MISAIDGGFAAWSVWSTCSVTCGGGSRTRERNCTDPEPQYGGNNCTGPWTDTYPSACNIQNCRKCNGTLAAKA